MSHASSWALASSLSPNTFWPVMESRCSSALMPCSSNVRGERAGMSLPRAPARTWIASASLSQRKAARTAAFSRAKTTLLLSRQDFLCDQDGCERRHPDGEHIHSRSICKLGKPSRPAQHGLASSERSSRVRITPDMAAIHRRHHRSTAKGGHHTAPADAQTRAPLDAGGGTPTSPHGRRRRDEAELENLADCISCARHAPARSCQYGPSA